MWQPLKHGERDAYAEGDFSLDSLQMQLRARDPESSSIFSGPGTIEQTAEGDLRFVLFHRGEPPPTRRTFFGGFGGDITEEDLFDLSLQDTSGREWESTHILPKCDFATAGGVVCRGRIHSLKCTESVSDPDRSDVPDAIAMVFPDSYEIPTNETTRTERTVEGKVRGMRLVRNIWSFEDDDFVYRFEKSENDDLLVGSVFSQGAATLPHGFDSRIEEALWVVLFDRPMWSVLYRRSRGEETVILQRPRTLSSRPRLQPVAPVLHSPEDAANLFLRYLNYLSDYTEARYHPASVAVRRAVQASTHAVDAEARELAIEIEGIVKRDFSTLHTPKPRVLREVESAKAIFESWEGSDKMKRRVLGALDRMTQPNPRTALKHLRDDGKITEKQHSAWKKLRGAVAHGDPIDRPIEELVTLCDRLQQLMYFLVFHAVGYEGQYVHRVGREFAVRDFPR